MFNAHITKKQFLAMWKIKDLEWRKYLTYIIIYGYIRYNEPKGYGVLEFTMGYLGLYALKYYCRLKIEYCSYYHRHQIVICGHLTFVMTLISKVPNHVMSQEKQVLEEWKKTIGIC
jgi:hypothetical protein